MTLRTADLSPAALSRLPEPCRSCLFWERGDRAGSVSEVQARIAKEAAWQASLLEWGPPGVMVTERSELVAFALVGPAAAYRRVQQLGPPASRDAYVMATVWLADDVRHQVVEVLLQAVLRTAARAGRRGVESYADRTLDPWPIPRHTAAGCTLPEAFLTGLGFVLHHEHHRFPLMRCDLRQTVRWQPAVSGALRGVRGVVRGDRVLPRPVQSATPPRQRSAGA